LTPSKSPILCLGELSGVEMSDELGMLLAADRLPTPKNLAIRNLDHVNAPDPEDDRDFDEELVVVLSVTSEGDRALVLVDVGVGEDEGTGGGGADPTVTKR
jgi:hypothetical protein